MYQGVFRYKLSWGPPDHFETLPVLDIPYYESNTQNRPASNRRWQLEKHVACPRDARPESREFAQMSWTRALDQYLDASVAVQSGTGKTDGTPI
jgi:hypothetical protein